MRLSRVRCPAYGHTAYLGLKVRCICLYNTLKGSNNQLSRERPWAWGSEGCRKSNVFLQHCPSSTSTGPATEDLRPDQAATQPSTWALWLVGWPGHHGAWPRPGVRSDQGTSKQCRPSKAGNSQQRSCRQIWTRDLRGCPLTPPHFYFLVGQNQLKGTWGGYISLISVRSSEWGRAQRSLSGSISCQVWSESSIRFPFSQSYQSLFLLRNFWMILGRAGSLASDKPCSHLGVLNLRYFRFTFFPSKSKRRNNFTCLGTWQK